MSQPDGLLNEEFLKVLKDDRQSFAQLSSASKVWLYRSNGAAIGTNVEISTGSLILSPFIELGDNVRIGKDVCIECDSVVIGRLSYIGDGSSIRARRVTLGENVFLYRNVEIGGGGARDPEAEIFIDSHCHIGQDVHLNCCRAITIGEESTITMGTAIMTHAFANSILEGYQAVFAPVHIGRRVQLGIRCVVFPGVTIGDGAVVGNNSSVLSDVPSGYYVVGVPARRIGKAARTLDADRRAALAREMLHEFLRHLSLHGVPIEEIPATSFAMAHRVRHRSGSAILLFSEQARPEDIEHLCHAKAEEEIVCTFLEWQAETERLLHPQVTLIDLIGKRLKGPGGPLTETLREFLRKRGIRLRPRTWTYRGGIV